MPLDARATRPEFSINHGRDGRRRRRRRRRSFFRSRPLRGRGPLAREVGEDAADAHAGRQLARARAGIERHAHEGGLRVDFGGWRAPAVRCPRWRRRRRASSRRRRRRAVSLGSHLRGGPVVSAARRLGPTVVRLVGVVVGPVVSPSPAVVDRRPAAAARLPRGAAPEVVVVAVVVASWLVARPAARVVGPPDPARRRSAVGRRSGRAVAARCCFAHFLGVPGPLVVPVAQTQAAAAAWGRRPAPVRRRPRPVRTVGPSGRPRIAPPRRVVARRIVAVVPPRRRPAARMMMMMMVRGPSPIAGGCWRRRPITPRRRCRRRRPARRRVARRKRLARPAHAFEGRAPGGDAIPTPPLQVLVAREPARVEPEPAVAAHARDGAAVEVGGALRVLLRLKRNERVHRGPIGTLIPRPRNRLDAQLAEKTQHHVVGPLGLHVAHPERAFGGLVRRICRCPAPLATWRLAVLPLLGPRAALEALLGLARPRHGEVELVQRPHRARRRRRTKRCSAPTPPPPVFARRR
mmetsp:Transcript_10791/g.43672  ORF Transcript_10791/g.43672 Transcript_10791/m.43672 type:complete len:520 (+) Transcript_10791:2132-3691(+)